MKINNQKFLHLIVLVFFANCLFSISTYGQKITEYKTKELLIKQWVLAKFEITGGETEDLTGLNTSITFIWGDAVVKQDSKTITKGTWYYNHKKSKFTITDTDGRVEYTILNLTDTILEVATKYKGKEGKMTFKKAGS